MKYYTGYDPMFWTQLRFLYDINQHHYKELGTLLFIRINV